MAFPPEFITRTKAILGAEYEQLEEALSADAPVSIRMNRKKSDYTPAGEPVPWSHTGYYLPERLSFTFDPLFHAGHYYVQEASSMFLEQAVRQLINEPVTCLDLCASPGGKSTLLLSTLPEGSLLVSNEIIRTRSHILAENLSKWGYPASIVTNNDPAELGELTHFFDVIVTDVPCSGEGMFRKDAGSMDEWSPANVELCAGRQRRILNDVWNALKPGGLLIYSTCTYNTEEDEENVQYIVEQLGAEPVSLDIPDTWQISGPLKYNHPVYRFFPHKTKGEGFFLAVLRKDEGEIIRPRQSKDKKGKDKTKAPAVPVQAETWIQHKDQYQFEVRGETVRAFPKEYYPLLQQLYSSLKVIGAGITLGEVKGKDLIPDQSLALSCHLNREAFSSCEINWEEAIRYLRKEALVLPPDLLKGYVLLTYKGAALGFVKHLGNRANNLYPQEWRIRSGYLPDEVRLL